MYPSKYRLINWNERTRALSTLDEVHETSLVEGMESKATIAQHSFPHDTWHNPVIPSCDPHPGATSDTVRP